MGLKSAQLDKDITMKVFICFQDVRGSYPQLGLMFEIMSVWPTVYIYTQNVLRPRYSSQVYQYIETQDIEDHSAITMYIQFYTNRR